MSETHNPLSLVRPAPHALARLCRFGFVLFALCLFPASAQNLLTNPGFESGFTSWSIRGGGTLQPATRIHSGLNAALVTNRTASTQGLQQSLAGLLIPGASYYCAAWVQTDTAASNTVSLGVELVDGTGTHLTNVASAVVTNGAWVFLAGIYDLQPTGAVQDVRFCCTGPAPGTSLLVDDAAVVPLSGLRLAARNAGGVIVGGIGSDTSLTHEPDYASVVGSDYHVAGPENALKFSGTEPQPSNYTFTAGDTIINHALACGQQARGHTLIWHGNMPSWLTNNSYTTGQLQQVVYDHIDTVASHYRDQLYCWDVVNEAFNTDGSVRSSVFYNQPGFGFAGQGTKFIEMALQRAHAADPQAKMVYNDYGTDVGNAKSDAIYKMAADFKKRGVPLDAIGFQEHISPPGPNLTQWRTNLQRFNDLGVDIHITELDVKIPIDTNTGAATAANLSAQADTYFNLLSVALAFPRTRLIQTWGFTDLHSWIPSSSPGYGAALPLDTNYNRKPAWWAIYNVLANQAENLPVTAISSGDTHSVISNTLFSAGQARLFSANAANDSITLTVRVPYSGSWNVQVGVRKDTNSGTFQLAAAPAATGSFSNIGSAQNLYASSASYAELDLGNYTFALAGDYRFRFTVTGKSSSSSGYALALDYIRIAPSGADGNQPPSLDAIPNQAILKNSSLPPLPFRVFDRETVESALQVSVTSSDPQLFPSNNLALSAFGPQYLLTARPAPNHYGTATLSLTVQDADGALAQTNFTVSVTNVYSAPVLDPVPDTNIVQDTVALVPFAMWDTVDDVSTLTLAANTSNPSLVPATNLVISGTGTNRLVTLTPLPGRVGETCITMTLSDPAGRSTTNSFILQVNPAPLSATQHLNNIGFEAPFSTVSSVTPTNSITGLLANGWTENSKFSPYYPTVLYEAETNDIPSGQFAQKVTLYTNGSPNFQLIQGFSMVTGRVYTASVWLKSALPMNVTLSLGQNVSPYTAYYSTTAAVTNYWRRFTVSGPGPTNVAGRITLRTTQPGTLWLEEGSVTSQPVNTPPVLSPLSNVLLNAGQLLLLTNTATDPQSPPQLLTYTLLTGPANALLNSTSGVLQWRPAAAQANTTNLFTLKVSDDGSPSLSATQAFKATVNPLARPSVTSSLQASTAQLLIKGDPGPDYIVQASQDLFTWTSLSTNFAPVLPFTWTDPTCPATSRFYRILLTP